MKNASKQIAKAVADQAEKMTNDILSKFVREISAEGGSVEVKAEGWFLVFQFEKISSELQTKIREYVKENYQID